MLFCTIPKMIVPSYLWEQTLQILCWILHKQDPDKVKGWTIYLVNVYIYKESNWSNCLCCRFLNICNVKILNNICVWKVIVISDHQKGWANSKLWWILKLTLWLFKCLTLRIVRLWGGGEFRCQVFFSTGFWDSFLDGTSLNLVWNLWNC